MLQLNIEFQEQYKRLDKICKEMYSRQEGVSAYINEMEETPFNTQRQIPDWESAYRQLKHLRWMRNQLAHELDINSDFCTEDDIDCVKQFYSDILNGDDPLALANRLRRQTLARQITKSRQYPVQNEPVSTHNSENTPHKSLWSRIKAAFKRWFS